MCLGCYGRFLYWKAHKLSSTQSMHSSLVPLTLTQLYLFLHCITHSPTTFTDQLLMSTLYKALLLSITSLELYKSKYCYIYVHSFALHNFNHLLYAWKCLQYKISANFTDSITFANNYFVNISHQRTSFSTVHPQYYNIVATDRVFELKHVKND